MHARADSSEPSALIAWLATLNSGLIHSQSDVMSDEMRQAQCAFMSLADSLPLNLVIKDAEGRRVFVNRRYLETHQAAFDDVLGKTDFDLFPEEIARKFSADDAEVLRTGRTMHDSEELQTQDGRRRWIKRMKAPVQDADGRIVGVQVLFWDVTDHKQAEHALEHEQNLLHALMNNIPDAIYFKDRESRFLRISRAQAEKFSLVSPNEATGKTDADFFTAEHAQQALADELAIISSGQPVVARVEKETWSDRSDTWVSTTKMPLRDTSGQIVGTFGISRDVTELKRMQDELREARDAADAASEAKSDFLANMSHEIRTPMNAIIGMTELLLDTGLTPTQQEYLRMVQESGESLLGLLNDILDFSKIEAGRMELDSAPFDVRDVLGDTLKSLALRAHNKGLELAYAIDSGVPPVLSGDAGRLRQVIVNLVGNAIKFTDVGEVVLEVCCESRTKDQATLLVSVRDTGVGIPPEQQSRIFTAFEQGDASTTRLFGGTGLGLAISSRLVGMMGGRIWVESEPDQGSTFSFTVTVGVVESESHERRRAVIVSDTPVLAVDDNATNRRILLDMLTNWGMKPTLAKGAREGFSHLQDAVRRGRPFRMVLLDINMPEVDGYELAAWIREDPELANTPLVMLTSSSRPGDTERRSALRISTHLWKPVKQSELFDAMVSGLGMSAVDEAKVGSAATSSLRTFDGLRVLLAEDNTVNQKLAVGVLTKLGCRTTVACDGRQAVAVWGAEDFDVVLMDVQMPEMDGLEAAQVIRQRERGSDQHTRIIAMTAHAMTGDRDRCLAAGMDDYLSKPVRIHELSEKLADVLGTKVGESTAPSVTALEDPIDWADALEAAGADRSLLQVVIDAFFEESEPLMQQIRDGVGLRDEASLKKAAHTLKGMLLSVGVRRESTLVFNLERMEMSENWADRDAALATLEGQMGVLLPLLREGPP
jgi:two-component system sensor histidine kinase/response regulator